jgi:hypothetical protein
LPPTIALLDEIHLARKLIEPCFDRRAQLADICHLHRIVLRKLGELVEFGKNQLHRLLVIPKKFRPRRQQVGARGAFGAADFEQKRVNLVFHLDGVDHTRVVFPQLVDKQRGGGADGNQHQKSRRKQQDLTHCAPTLGIRRHGNLGSDSNKVVSPNGKI